MRRLSSVAEQLIRNQQVAGSIPAAGFFLEKGTMTQRWSLTAALVLLVAVASACDTGNLVGQSCLTSPDCASKLVCCGLPSGSTCQNAGTDGGCR